VAGPAPEMTVTFVAGAAGTHRGFTFDVSEIERYIGGWRDLDLTRSMSIVGTDLMLAVDDKFENSGPGWPELAESTLRNRRGATAQILVDTTRLRGSIRSEAEEQAVELFTDVEYAVFHVSSEPRTKIPLRDFFDLAPEVWEEAATVILGDIIDQHGVNYGGGA
jgi:phage gpG-like protein